MTNAVISPPMVVSLTDKLGVDGICVRIDRFDTVVDDGQIAH